LRPSARAVRITFIVGLALAVALAPQVGWWLTRARTLGVVVVDKTVPFVNFREHAAIPWLLHALKIQKKAGGLYDAAHDYLGFDPVAKTGRELTAQDLVGADVLFVTDTYGVYVGDYARPGDQAALERSPKIYGGVSSDEASVIESFSAKGGMVLGEFNTFASPTGAEARATLERLFGVHWTRWVARYWPDLQDPNEVPKWVGATYERVYHAPFDLQGAGLVFVHEDGDIVVLREKLDLDLDVLTQERTPTGAEFGFPERGQFRYWVDILTDAGGEVLYEHLVHATAAGAAKLEAHGLPIRFPAVTRRGEAYYFAGDFVDNAVDLGNPERAGLLGYRQARTNGCGAGDRDEAFFWGFYAPIVSRLLSSRASSNR
jgi:hypothetical protein